jgi:hypothetical protein
MALSLREKSTISRRIKENAAKLSAGGLSLREKSTVSRAIKEDVALLIGDTLPVQATELPNDSTPRHWQIDENRLSDPSGGSEVIEAWDLAKADALLEKYLEYDPLIPAELLARKFIEDNLQGRKVKTKIGECVITSASKGKLPIASGRNNKIKLRCIPHVPEILINGVVGKLEELNKERKDNVVGYYPFTHILGFDDELEVQVVVKVGERTSGLPLVYNMNAKWFALDNATSVGESTPIPPYNQANDKTKPASKNAFDLILYSTYEDVNDGLNIKIIAVWDKDGNRLPEFEDDANHGLPDHSTLPVPQPLSAIDIDPDLETFTETDLIPDGDDNTVKTAKGTKVSTGFAVAFVVREDNNGNFYHNHTLYREKGAQEIWVELEESSNQRSNPSDIAPQDLSLYRPRPKINTNISPESVDENDVTKSSGFTHFVILWNLRTV